MESGHSLAAKQDWEMAHAARAATATANLIEGLPVSIIRGARKAKNGSAHCVRSKTRNTHNRTGTRRPKFRRTNHAPHFRKRAHPLRLPVGIVTLTNRTPSPLLGSFEL